MSSAVIDHGAIGRSRVATQYTSSPKFLAYIDALLATCNELEDVLQTIALQTDIDQARGVNLDVIGDIVGVSRLIPFSVAVSFFGFDDSVPAATVFGEDGTLTAGTGSRFREESEAATNTSILGDPEYRLLIKAKIFKNHSRGTPEEVIQGIKFLFDAPNVIVDDYGIMAISISIGRNLTFLEKAMITYLDILPRPAGVRILGSRSTYDISNYFGFDDQTGSKTFGEEGLAGGGIFAEEF